MIMKLFAALLALAATASASAAVVYDVYPTKYDDINIDDIIQNKRLFDNYFQCLIKKGKCNEEGTILKNVIPDALITDCRKCNDHQKVSVKKVITFLIKERNSDWQELLKVYDAKGDYRAQYAHYLEES